MLKNEEEINTSKIKVDVDQDGLKDLVIEPELKVKHKNSKLRYTVYSISTNSVILKTPEGDKFLVDKKSFEREYCI
jgi:hypothetical protein